jgi:hypothetical protein
VSLYSGGALDAVPLFERIVRHNVWMRGATLFLALMTAGAVFPQLSQEERDRLTRELIASGRAFQNSITGLTDSQWNFRSQPGAWSIGNYAEYGAATQDSLFQTVWKLGSSPLVATKGTRTPDEMIGKLMREGSGQPPVNYGEVPHWQDRAALLRHFEETRKRTIGYVNRTQNDLRMRFRPHPVYGTLDGYQWILLMAAESERCAKAIDGLKSDAGYPK